MLDAIGLSEDHTAVYEGILRAHTTTRDDLSMRLGIPSARLQEIMEHLEALGLVARPAAARDQVVASPPSLALRPLLLERERSLSAAHEAVVGLSDLYREGAGERGISDVVDVVHGADAVRQRLAQLQAAAVREVRVFMLSEPAFITADENIEEDRALRRGVRYRVIAESGAMELPGFLAGAREAAAYGEHVRVAPSLPTRLMVADGELALLPMRSRGQERAVGGLLVHPSGLLDLIMAIFDRYWASATDFLAVGELSSEHDDVDRDLLKLLLLGLTDAAIARQLGISLRTVQRRIADLMATAGVTTRIQLGAEAVRRDWA